MNDEMLKLLQHFIQSSLKEYYSKHGVNIFDKLVQFCKDYYSKPVHSLAEIKAQKSTKLRGDIFEHFCYLYLIHVLGMSQVWLLADLPDDIMIKLNLDKHDLGIDLVSKDHQNRYYAIQAKYRQKKEKTIQGLGWKQLSTFYAIVNRTGPYHRHIVMTNTDFVRHVGNKSKLDLSICKKRFQNTSINDWRSMGGISPGQKLGSFDIPVDLLHNKVKDFENKENKSENAAIKNENTLPNSAEARLLRMAWLESIEKNQKELSMLKERIKTEKLISSGRCLLWI